MLVKTNNEKITVKVKFTVEYPDTGLAYYEDLTAAQYECLVENNQVKTSVFGKLIHMNRVTEINKIHYDKK